MRSGRRPRARVHASWSPAGRLRNRRTILRTAGVLGALLAVLLVGVNVYAVSFLDSLPSVRNLDATQFSGDTIIQDRGGALLADVGQQGDRRQTVSLDQISPRVMQGTISIEDRTFWTNPGFDTQAIVRTAANNFRAGGVTGGASTITQQLAKQVFLSSGALNATQNGVATQSLSRKLKELALAYQLSQTYSKRQILELYLNVSYYGSQQYGIQAAAQTYFHRDARSVDLAQASMLAGLPQSPDAYNPTDHFEAARARQKEVLDAMLRDGAVSQPEAAAAWQERLQVYTPASNYRAPRFVDYVERELRSLGFNPGQQQLVVRTTLDLGQQQLAEQIVIDNYKKNLSRDRGGRLSAAEVAMDPKTGQILSYVGSEDPMADQFDFIDLKPVNPGSSVKPFTYGKAILDGRITMDTPIVDGPSPYILKVPGDPKPYKITNYDTHTHGTLPARVALASSLNIPAVKVEEAEGVPFVVDFFRQMGMRPRIGPDDKGNYITDASDNNYGPSLTLGGYPITLMEELTALSAYADMGLAHKPEAILQVKDVKGRVLYQADPNRGAQQAVDPGVAFIIGAILSDNNNRAAIFGVNNQLHLPDRRVAAKTGTSENFHDGLTIGFTPDLASVFWIGDTAGTNPRTGELYTMVDGSDGVVVAAPAWHQFMEQALKGVQDHWYAMPSDVVQKGGSYFLASNPTKIDRLPGDNPGVAPSPNPNGDVPADPGSGPKPVNPLCQPPFRFPGCPSPGPIGPPVGG
jgi:membrane peptidoglycan carboxypeptidase